MSEKKTISSIIILHIVTVVLCATISVFATISIIGTLAYRGYAYNDDNLEAVSFLIECDYDCEIIDTIWDCQKGKATLLAKPNNEREPYLINLEIKEVSPFVYQWVIAEE